MAGEESNCDGNDDGDDGIAEAEVAPVSPLFLLSLVRVTWVGLISNRSPLLPSFTPSDCACVCACVCVCVCGCGCDCGWGCVCGRFFSSFSIPRSSNDGGTDDVIVCCVDVDVSVDVDVVESGVVGVIVDGDTAALFPAAVSPSSR